MTMLSSGIRRGRERAQSSSNLCPNSKNCEREWSVVLPLTPRMSALLLLARREAELLGHAECGAEHVLLAALWEGDGVAAQVIQGLDASDAVRGMLLERMRSASYQPGEVSPPQLIEKAADEANRRGDTYIGTEHVLLAMTRSHDIVGGALDALGISGTVRDRTQSSLDHSNNRPGNSGGSPESP